MNTNLTEAQIFSGTTNHLNRMNLLSAGQFAFTMVGHWTPNATGGTFTISDNDSFAQLTTIINNVKNHARNSHYYYLFDEPSLASLTGPQIDLCRNRLRTYRNKIRELDPLGKMVGADFRKSQLSPASAASGGSGRTFGVWGGTDAPSADVYTDRVMDEIWLSYYPRPTASAADISTVAAIQGYCDAAGIPFSQFVSAHNFQDTLPSYPTQANFQDALTQAAGSNAINVIVYIWEDSWDTNDTSSPNLHLRDNPAGKLTQAQVGTVLAAYD
jgi:hypothetical protein